MGYVERVTYNTCVPEPRPCSQIPTYERIAVLRTRHVIVAGYGPVGRLCAKQLEATGFNVTIIEQNESTVARQLRLNKDIVFGSATNPETLLTAGIERAEVLIIAIPDEDEALEACKAARSLNPNVYITARTNFFSKGLLCRAAGADQVIVEEVVTAEAMRRAVVERLTDPDEAI